MSANLGIGLCPFGLAPFGFGSPAQATPQVSALLPDQTNVSRDARLIDPALRDYIIDANGLTTGMPSVSQQVFLALTTTLGSAVNKTVGSTLLGTPTLNLQTYQSQIRNAVSDALTNLINPGTISLINVQTTLNKDRAGIYLQVNWIDNTTNQTQSTALTLQS